MPDCSELPADAAESSQFIIDNLKFVVPDQLCTDAYAVAAEDLPEVTNHSHRAQPESIMRPASVSDPSMTTTPNVAMNLKHAVVSQAKDERSEDIGLERLLGV